MSSTHTNSFAAELLKQGASGIAALTVERMFVQRPGLAKQYQPNPAMKWRDNVAARLNYLAAAVAAGRPTIFAQQTTWDNIAHSARGGAVGCDDLRTSLQCLREVLLQELPPQASNPVLKCLDEGILSLDTVPQDVPSLLNVQSPHGRLGAEYLLAILEGDRYLACSLILKAFQSSGPDHMSIDDIYIRILTPVQQELGRMWHLNESTVAEEHFATATTHTVMSALYPHLPRKPRNGKVALAASVETNAHDIGVRMVADYLEMDGWKAVYLGQNVPSQDLARSVTDFNCDLIALSASLVTHLPFLAETIKQIRAHAAHERQQVKVLVGGSAFCMDESGTLPHELGADGFASSVVDVVCVANRLVGIADTPA